MATISIGDKLGRYELAEEIGQGGMSVVYRGVDSQLRREVAVKVMHGFLAEQREARERFHREAVAVARLHHPHIIEIYDYSGEENESAYIVAELVDGQALSDLLEKGPLKPPEAALLLARPIADALAHAHAEGVIHRDLKPENILVGRDGALKLTDFGIARMLDNQTLTVTGTLLGSPAYMAPEYIDGNEPDARADIFSFGAMLYQMVTGELPFSGPSPHALLKRIAVGDYIPANQANPRVHGALARLIHKCLARDPDDRIQNAKSLLDEIDTLLGRLDIDPRPERLALLTDLEGRGPALEQELADRYLSLGRRALAEGRAGVAMDDLDRVLSIDPSNEEVRTILDRLTRRRAVRRFAVRAAWVALFGVLGAALTTGATIGAMELATPLLVRTEPLIVAPPEAEPGSELKSVALLFRDAGSFYIDDEPEPRLVVEAGHREGLQLAPGRYRFRLEGEFGRWVREVNLPADGPPFAVVEMDVPDPERVVAASVDVQPTPPAPPPTKSVTIRPVNTWVNMWVDEEPTPRVEKRQGVFEVELAYGEHRLKFLNDFSKQKEIVVRVGDNEPPGNEIIVSLDLKDAHLKVLGAPPGPMVVTVAGREHLVTDINRDEPILVPLARPREEKLVVVKKEGYQEFSQTLRFAPGRPEELNVNLEPL